MSDFAETYLEACNQQFGKKLADLKESNADFNLPALSAVQLDAPGAVQYFEMLLYSVLFKSQGCFLETQTEHSKMDLARIRLQVITGISEHVLGRFDLIEVSALGDDNRSKLTDMVTSFVYLIVVFPITDFVKDTSSLVGDLNQHASCGFERLNLAENRVCFKSKTKWLPPAYDVKISRFIGFWLSYLNSMRIDFTEMALLLPLAVSEAVKTISPTIYQANFRELHENLTSVLRNYVIHRVHDGEIAVVEREKASRERSTMLCRNLPFIAEGVFDGGKDLLAHTRGASVCN